MIYLLNGKSILIASPEQVTERITDADIVLINKAPLLAPQIEQAKRLKLISIFATGTNIIDLKAAREARHRSQQRR